MYAVFELDGAIHGALFVPDFAFGIVFQANYALTILGVKVRDEYVGQVVEEVEAGD